MIAGNLIVWNVSNSVPKHLDISLRHILGKQHVIRAAHILPIRPARPFFEKEHPQQQITNHDGAE